MNKLEKYIKQEELNGYKIEKCYAHSSGPGIVDYEKNCVLLNLKFIWGHVKFYNENDMIGVLYHEIGHLQYFKTNPILRKEDFNDEYKTKSEFYAFSESLKMTLLIAEGGDIKPLKSTVEKMRARITKIELNDYRDENNSISHCAALLLISKQDVFKDCLRFLELNNSEMVYKKDEI